MAILYSYLFVFGMIGLATLLTKVGLLNNEGGRKFIHIAVGNWMIVAALLFDDMILALIPPFTFIIINYLSYRFHWFKAMERTDSSTKDLGTVYYAISLFVVVLADYRLFDDWTFSVLPILVLAYGDGLSAIVGTSLSSRKLVGNKTLYGTLTMFVVSLIVAYVMISNLWIVLLIGVAASLIELFSPKGIDNLTLPLGLYVILLLV